jgi:selenocysteine lyase/cysteine desulfurase
MPIDVDAVRAETPGCAEVAHLNNAGSALPPAAVTRRVIEHLRLEERIGGYEAARAVAAELDRGYGSLARLIGARPEEIAYVENATRAWDMAFYGIGFRPGDRVLTTTSEYASNGIAFRQVARKSGVSVEVVPDDETGQLSLDALADMLGRGGVRLVAVNHVPTHDGLVNPAAEIGALAREAGALYLLDACQSVGQLRVDVADIGCDMLSATGRKYLRAPRGTGFLYVRGAVLDQLEPPFLDLHAARWTGPESYEPRADARRFETWERYLAGQLGLGVAAEYALALGLDAVEARVIELGERLRARLAEVPGVTVRDRGARRGGAVTFTREGHPASEIQQLLDTERINVSVTQSDQYRYDAEPGGPVPRVRASAHYYNTEDEIDQAVEVVAALVR